MDSPAERVAAALDAMNGFPVTPFAEDGTFVPEVFAQVVSTVCQGRPGAIFAACGTGEFWSLTVDERVAVAEVAVEVVADEVPVLVGWAGTDPESRRTLATLHDRGVAGLLLMSPEAWPWDRAGLVDYYRILLGESGLPGIIYVKDWSRLEPAAWVELTEEVGALGLKDGVGNPDTLSSLLAAGLRPERVINGTPTAEWFAPAFWALGIRGYSSAVMNFAPTLARAFRDALEAGDKVTIKRLSTQFFWELRQIRSRSPSYAVSLVKAAVAARGIAVGRTRPPIGWPDAVAVQRVRELLRAADELVEPTLHAQRKTEDPRADRG